MRRPVATQKLKTKQTPDPSSFLDLSIPLSTLYSGEIKANMVIYARFELGGVAVGENNRGSSVSLRKLEANRRNARRSTGPRTKEGKSRSRKNALKHGVLASALLIDAWAQGINDEASFEDLLGDLNRDLAPVGKLEELLVERVAVCWWRQRRALQCEGGLIRRELISSISQDDLDCALGRSSDDPLLDILEHHYLPTEGLDRVLRYETSIQRQLAYALNQLERLQRARKGEHVPAPVSVQLSKNE
jgi:hypothetical protein